MKPKIVLDTNIIISALKSRQGAANKLLSILGGEKYISCVSVPLVLEYEEVIGRIFPKMPKSDINDLLDYICKQSLKSPIYYLWRPVLKDPKDDMILEIAVASSADAIVTYNVKDFLPTKDFGIALASPKEILFTVGVKNEHN
jgi:putative PIN family toxin of toxin-antitoxin system